MKSVSRVVLNHNLIMCDLGDKQKVAELSQKLGLPKFSKLKQGYHVVLLICWLQQKLATGNQALEKLLGQPISESTLSAIVRMVRESVVRVDSLDAPMCYGGNILLKPNEPISKSEIIAAFRLFTSQHPIDAYLTGICKKHYSINYLDQTNLSELLELIDFPIPSVYSLLIALGHHYIADNPLLDKGIVIGVVNTENMLLYCGYKGNKYKVLKYDIFCSLYRDALLTEPIMVMDAAYMNIATNDYIRGN